MTLVGKALRWTEPTFASKRRLVNEYVILWEEGDRMLVYNVKYDILQWMIHARIMLDHNGHKLELIGP